MSSEMGMIAWHDLTVEDAGAVRDFYRQVAGWSAEPVEMNGYEDYVMKAADGSAVGICHARGENADLPAQWLCYVRIPDLDAAIAAATRAGGTVRAQPRSLMGGRMAVVEDPAGAVMALWQDASGDAASMD